MEERIEGQNRVCIVGHGMATTNYAITKLAADLESQGFVVVDAPDDGAEILNVRYAEIPKLVFNYDRIETRLDIDDKYNWRDVELSRNLYNSSRILNTSLNTVKNKRNIFKNKRR